MDFRRRAILLLVALCAVAGCRQNQAANRELIEREMRLQEDRIYELEGKLEDAQRELERLRGGSSTSSGSGGSRTLVDPTCPIDFNSGTGSSSNGAGASVAPGSSSGASPSRSTTTPAPRVDDTSPPVVELPPGANVAPPFTGPPIMSPPDANKPEGIPGGAVPGNSNAPAPSSTTPAAPPFKPMSSPKFRSPSAAGRDFGGGIIPPGAVAAPSPSPAASVVAAPPVVAEPNVANNDAVKNITLHAQTGGWNSDGKPGDEGVRVIVEPRNARGDLVQAAGELSIVLIDPALEGDAGRYARWDFAPDDAASLYRPTEAGSGGGMYVELTWPDAPPQHSRLRLFARLALSDGRRLEASKDIVVASGGARTTTTLPNGQLETSATVGAATYWTDPSSGAMIPSDPAAIENGPMLVPAENAPTTRFSGGLATPIWRRNR